MIGAPPASGDLSSGVLTAAHLVQRTTHNLHRSAPLLPDQSPCAGYSPTNQSLIPRSLDSLDSGSPSPLSIRDFPSLSTVHSRLAPLFPISPSPSDRPVLCSDLRPPPPSSDFPLPVRSDLSLFFPHRSIPVSPIRSPLFRPERSAISRPDCV